jgi:hypothetical protein
VYTVTRCLCVHRYHLILNTHAYARSGLQSLNVLLVVLTCKHYASQQLCVHAWRLNVCNATAATPAAHTRAHCSLPLSHKLHVDNARVVLQCTAALHASAAAISTMSPIQDLAIICILTSQCHTAMSHYYCMLRLSLWYNTTVCQRNSLAALQCLPSRCP